MNWRKGPPPSIGWWPASVSRDPNSLRWWNGKHWSMSAGAWADTPVMRAARSATIKASSQDEIEWTDRPTWWPERSKT
jgi:hypothetical protein